MEPDFDTIVDLGLELCMRKKWSNKPRHGPMFPLKLFKLTMAFSSNNKCTSALLSPNIIIIIIRNKTSFKSPGFLEVEFEVPSLLKESINFLEHVQVRTNIQHPKRGALEVVLKSPSGNV